MSKEKTFTVVGTAVNKDGTMKVRWANDLVSRIKILIKAGCEEIDLIELPSGMTKLAAAEYLKQHRTLNAEQDEVVSLKIGEKSRVAKRRDMKATLSSNVKTRIKDKAPTDPRVEKFVEANKEAAE